MHKDATFEEAFIAYLQSVRTLTQEEVDTIAHNKAHDDASAQDAYEARGHEL